MLINIKGFVLILHIGSQDKAEMQHTQDQDKAEHHQHNPSTNQKKHKIKTISRVYLYSYKIIK
jgi:hypothetical protein